MRMRMRMTKHPGVVGITATTTLTLLTNDRSPQCLIQRYIQALPFALTPTPLPTSFYAPKVPKR